MIVYLLWVELYYQSETMNNHIKQNTPAIKLGYYSIGVKKCDYQMVMAV